MAETLHITLRQLQAFLAVAASGSFTRAAEQLHVTQAGLSAMVRELESQLECRLFERTTRQVVLTDAGHHLRPVAERSLADLRRAAGDLRARGEATRQRLRVGCTPLIAAGVMPEVLDRLQADAPGLQIELYDAERQQLARALYDSRLDVALGAFFERMTGLRRQVVFASELALVHRGPPAADARRWQTLRDEPLITLPDGNPIQRLVERQRGGAGANARPLHVVVHLETMLALVAAGHGKAVVPAFSRLAPQYADLAWTPLRPRVACDYLALTRAGDRPSPALQTFLQVFRQVCEPRLAAGSADADAKGETPPPVAASALR